MAAGEKQIQKQMQLLAWIGLQGNTLKRNKPQGVMEDEVAERAKAQSETGEY